MTIKILASIGIRLLITINTVKKMVISSKIIIIIIIVLLG
jgi:hypothetical protein